MLSEDKFLNEAFARVSEAEDAITIRQTEKVAFVPLIKPYSSTFVNLRKIRIFVLCWSSIQ